MQEETKELIESAQYELSRLHDALKPEQNSWTHRQMNQIMRFLRLALENERVAKKLERVVQRAVIDDRVTVFDFIPGDIVQTEDGAQGIVTKVESPFVYVKWIEESVAERRGERWLVNSVKRVN